MILGQDGRHGIAHERADLKPGAVLLPDIAEEGEVELVVAETIELGLWRELEEGDGGARRAFAQGPHRRSDEIVEKDREESEPDGAFAIAELLAHLLGRGLRVAEELPGPVEEPASRLVENEPFADPVEEGDAELFLERLDLAAQGGLGKVNAPRRRRHRQFLRRGNKVTKLMQFHLARGS